jgi:hypothetical protein
VQIDFRECGYYAIVNFLVGVAESIPWLIAEPTSWLIAYYPW